MKLFYKKFETSSYRFCYREAFETSNTLEASEIDGKVTSVMDRLEQNWNKESNANYGDAFFEKIQTSSLEAVREALKEPDFKERMPEALALAVMAVDERLIISKYETLAKELGAMAETASKMKSGAAYSSQDMQIFLKTFADFFKSDHPIFGNEEAASAELISALAVRVDEFVSAKRDELTENDFESLSKKYGIGLFEGGVPAVWVAMVKEQRQE